MFLTQYNYIVHATENIIANIINNTYRLWFRGGRTWSIHTGYWALLREQPVCESTFEFIYVFEWFVIKM